MQFQSSVDGTHPYYCVGSGPFSPSSPTIIIIVRVAVPNDKKNKKNKNNKKKKNKNNNKNNNMGRRLSNQDSWVPTCVGIVRAASNARFISKAPGCRCRRQVPLVTGGQPA